jgi:predicted amidohydrolase
MRIFRRRILICLDNCSVKVFSFYDGDDTGVVEPHPQEKDRRMKIGLVQTRPVKGDVAANVADAQHWASVAVKQGVGLLVFPELSMTGYEPSLARELAMTMEDERFAGLQRVSDRYGMLIGVGVPILEGAALDDGGTVSAGEGAAGGGVQGGGLRRGALRGDDMRGGDMRAGDMRAGDVRSGEGMPGGGVQIGMVIFRPDESRLVYAKQYLHDDEVPFFVPGREQLFLSFTDHKIAFAICYELSVPEHSANAYSHRADIYLASAAKTKAGMEKTMGILSGIACTYSMTVLLANAVGDSEDGVCAGGSAVVNNKGEVLGALGEDEEGMLIYDTATGALNSI